MIIYNEGIDPEEDLKDDLDDEQMDEFCPSCGEEYDEVDYEYQICHKCQYINRSGD